jgi:uncharacterized repeat protein (TIGR01451 family)
MKRFAIHSTIALVFGLGLTLALLLGLPAAEAAPTATTRYVAPWGDDTGNTCASPITPCRTVQQAVNLSWSGDDEVLVAEGVYTATSGPVLFIQATVVIRGGYSADFSAWNPQAHPTTLDGRGLMRVVRIQGDITPTLEGLQLTNGYVSGNGGGIYSVDAHPVISGCRIFSNTANSGEGGGVYLSNADNARLIDSEIFGNTAGSEATSGGGGGIYLHQSDDVALTNNLVLENHIIVGVAPGIGINASNARLLHMTLARNSGGRGRGIYTVDSTVWMTNTILVSHTVGIEASGSTVTATHTLWGTGAWANIADTLGSSISIGAPAVNWHELPGFIDPNGGNYHIGTGSGAIDKGLDAGVTVDIDGDLRPFCGGPDLGADETTCCANLNGTLYPTVQAAVDASTDPGDVVKVAGTCSGVADRDGNSQTVYISKTVTVRGGYITDDWNTSDPDINPTTLDAAEQGRVVYISSPSPITPTLEGLRLTNGLTGGCGGGIYAYQAAPVISGCHIHDNRSTSTGGGVCLSNTSGAMMMGNKVYSNTAYSTGGGVRIGDNATDTYLMNNMVVENDLTASGGGLGAGIYIYYTNAHLLHTTIARNSGGSGVRTSFGNAWLTNTILVSHTVGVEAGGMGTVYLAATLWGDGEWANGTDTDAVGGSIYTGTLNWWGAPAFVDPAGGDYHLGAGSAAFERGVSTGVPDDIDGDLRSVGLGMQPDLGADEALPTLTVTKTGPAWCFPESPITYTLSIVNSGVVTAHAITLSDTLPSGTTFIWASDSGNVKPGSDDVTWLIFTLGPGGGVVTRTFAVTATGDVIDAYPAAPADVIVNDDYLVRSYGTPNVPGIVPVTTQINRAPMADAGPSQSASPGALATLDGSGSSDPDSDPLTYGWAQTGGTPVALSSSTAVSPTFTVPSVPGETLTFTLTVTDTFGVAHSDVTTVTIKHYSYLPLVLSADGDP